jgi:hypothetical protein
MGTIRYANASGSNTSPYNSVATGATNPQTIMDLAVAGDENRYYGTFVLSSTLNLNVNAGSVAAGFIQHNGCNASGVVDGSMAVFNGNNVATNGITISKSYHWLKNIEIKNCMGTGFLQMAVTNYNWRLENVWSHNNGGSGFDTNSSYSNGSMMIKCRSYSNTGSAIGATVFGLYIKGCVFYSCAQGIPALYISVMEDCLMYDMTNYGIGSLAGYGYTGSRVRNCIFNNCKTAVTISDTSFMSSIIKCIFSNNVTNGLTIAAACNGFEDWNLYYNNGANRSVGAGGLLIQGGNSVDTATNPYAGASPNFNRNSTDLFSTADALDATNTYYHTAGIPHQNFFFTDTWPMASNVKIGTGTFSQQGTMITPSLNVPAAQIDHIIRTPTQVDIYGYGFGATQGGGLLTDDLSVANGWTVTLWSDSHVTATHP